MNLHTLSKIVFMMLLVSLCVSCTKAPPSYSRTDGKMRPVNAEERYTAEQLKKG